MLQNFPWVLLLLIFFFGYWLDSSPFSGRQTYLLLTIPPAQRPPKLPPQKQAGGLAIVLTALRPQEHQVLRRPPTRPPLPQRQAPKSPSQAST